MRRMRRTAIGLFALLAGVVLAAALASAWHGAGLLPGLGDFRGIVIASAAIFFTYLYAIAALRALLALAPLHAGPSKPGHARSSGTRCTSCPICFYSIRCSIAVLSRFR